MGRRQARGAQRTPQMQTGDWPAGPAGNQSCSHRQRDGELPGRLRPARGEAGAAAPGGRNKG